MERSIVFAKAASGAVGQLSAGSIVLIVLPATIALIGVIVSTITSSVTAHRAEDRRARNAVFGQVLEAGRKAELDALYATADFIAKLKTFNRAMSGNSGEGEDDARSAHAFQEFVGAFEGFDPLTEAALTVEALGATDVSARIRQLRAEALSYVMSLEPPIFRSAHARQFEERADTLMNDLIEQVRQDFGTDKARALYRGTDSTNAKVINMDQVAGAAASVSEPNAGGER